MKRYQVNVNGNSYQVEVEELPSGQGFSAPVATQTKAPITVPTNVPAQVAAPLVAPTPVQSPAQAGPSGTTGAHKINAPMQGKIVGIKVAVGDVVKQNDVLVVLEAMKMENEIVSPVSGTVASVNTTLGHTVQTAELLISIN